MKVIGKGYGEEGYEILLIPETQYETDKILLGTLKFVSHISKDLGIAKITIKNF